MFVSIAALIEEFYTVITLYFSPLLVISPKTVAKISKKSEFAHRFWFFARTARTAFYNYP
jgi:hypothetical protein